MFVADDASYYKRSWISIYFYLCIYCILLLKCL